MQQRHAVGSLPRTAMSRLRYLGHQAQSLFHRRLGTVPAGRGDAAAERVINDLETACAELDGPFASVHLPTVRRNLDDLVRRAGGTPIRVASKSVRCCAILELALAHPGIAGVMAYSPREAAWLLTEGVTDDILLGYPTVDREGIRCALRAVVAARGRQERASEGAVERAPDTTVAGVPEHSTAGSGGPGPGGCGSGGLRTQSVRLVFMVDAPEQIDLLAEQAAAVAQECATEGRSADDAGTPAVTPEVCLDIDASYRLGPLHLGTRRSPLRTPEDAVAVGRYAEQQGLRVAGIMFYEALVAGVPDASPAIAAVKRATLADLATRRGAVVTAVRETLTLGDLDFVNAGGTGSLEVSSADACVTEVTSGSGIYTPALFDRYRSFEPHPALFFALSAVRHPSTSMTTFAGGGYLASGTGDASRLPRPVWPTTLRLTGTEGAGEVQTPMTGRVPIGEHGWFRPAKAGESLERFAELHVVDVAAPESGAGSSGEVVRRTVPTYRGEGMCFG